MRTKTILAAVTLVLIATPAVAATYPVSGRWGESKTSQQGAIDCARLRVIGFNGEQRTDSGGGVPGYRNVTVTPEGQSFRITDIFTTGQIRNGRVTYTLRQLDNDRIELQMQQGGTLKLQRCK